MMMKKKCRKNVSKLKLPDKRLRKELMKRLRDFAK
jgi:hypothetical protein